MAKIKLQEEIGFKEFEELLDEIVDTDPTGQPDDEASSEDESTTTENAIDDLDEIDDTDEEGEPKKETKTLYVTNKDLLAEIHRSKMSFCEIIDEKYFHYDAIVNMPEEVTETVIEESRVRRAKRLTTAAKIKLKAEGAKPQVVKDTLITPESILLEDLTFRVMRLDHIPLDPTRKRKGKGPHANHVKTQFLPFMHMAFIDGVLTEVARSHWKGDFQTGEFSLHRGQITTNLAKMFMLLVDRYSRRSNWRSYTYLDEMKGHALLQLSQIGLQFNEAVGDNPFAFYTTSAKNCFTRMLNLEKKNQNIRDDILIMCGSTPSFTRQNDEEHARVMKKERERMGITVAEPTEEVDDLLVVDELEEQLPVEIEEKKKESFSMYDDIVVNN